MNKLVNHRIFIQFFRVKVLRSEKKHYLCELEIMLRIVVSSLSEWKVKNT